MKAPGLTAVALALSCFFCEAANAAAYDFNVTYTGGGNATLDAGSDNPIGTTLVDGDSFEWTIRAFGSAYWNVVTGGDFFPLMAFGVNETGDRIGTFSLALRNDGSNVFSFSAIDELQQFVHIGTNVISLASGLKFDEMYLSYSLTQAIENATYDPVPPDLLPIGSTPNGLLPIFGAPDRNRFSPGIGFVTAVPEPQTYALMLAGLAVVGWAARRQRREGATARGPIAIGR